MMSSKDWIKKHENDSKRIQKKLDRSNLSSCSYSPLKDKTFDSLSKSSKKVCIYFKMKESTLMKITKIDKRAGLATKFSSPGPGAH